MPILSPKQTLGPLPIVVAALLALSSCSQSPARLAIPTKLPSTATLGPTASRTSTPTSTSTKTATPTELPTPAPLPTFDDPLAQTRGLLDNNGGCLLPCWWGITPGSTSWREAKQFLDRLGDYVVFERATGAWEPSPGYEGVVAFYHAPDLNIDYSVSTLLVVREGVVQWLELDPDSSMASGLTPNKLISDLGPPDEILIHDTTLLTLWYQSIGVAATYFFTETASPHRLCFDGFYGTRMWNPADFTSPGQFPRTVPFVQSTPFEKAYGVSAADVVSSFSTSPSRTCVDLPTR